MLVAMAAGCGRAPRYDQRLVQADSLMQPAPDSALAIVEAINPESLTSEGDRAYRDLLLTQARYKCYAPFTTDSIINRALDYYCRHTDEREKLTRAYLYKGGVMEELGRPDSAIYYYKHVEEKADKNDLFNLGYSKLRIAELYQNQYSHDSTAIIRLKEAIRCFKALNDTNFVMVCYGKLGAICGVHYPDSTEFYLTKAIELAQHINPSRQYTYKSKLAGFLYYYHKDYPRANKLSMEVLRDGSDDCLEYQFYYYAAMSFLKMGKVDSAKYVLEKTPAPIDAVDSMNRYEVISEIAKAENRPLDYGENAITSKDLTSQILLNKQETELVHSELKFNKNLALDNERNANRLSNILKATLLIVTILLAISILSLRYRLKVKDKERLLMQNDLNTVIEQLKEQLEETNNQNAGLDTSTLLRYRVEALQELFDSIRFRARHQDTNKKRELVTLRNILSGLSDHYLMMNVELGDSFWEKIKLSVDGEYNGIVSFMEQKYPNLTARDLRIICLLCSNVTPQIIKLCMNLTNVKTVSNYRGLIMKKTGLKMTFDEFIKKYMDGEIA